MATWSHTSSSPSARPHAPTVLIVDDEPAIAAVVCAVLEESDIPADACPVGWEAQRCIREQQPKVVILDVRMPTVDGISLFYSLRNDPKTRDIPVIFFTANAQKVQMELPNYTDMGAILVPKPFDLDTLLDGVSRALAL